MLCCFAGTYRIQSLAIISGVCYGIYLFLVKPPHHFLAHQPLDGVNVRTILVVIGQVSQDPARMLKGLNTPPKNHTGMIYPANNKKNEQLKTYKDP
jgi:hypothetical protein